MICHLCHKCDSEPCFSIVCPRRQPPESRAAAQPALVRRLRKLNATPWGTPDQNKMLDWCERADRAIKEAADALSNLSAAQPAQEPPAAEGQAVAWRYLDYTGCWVLTQSHTEIAMAADNGAKVEPLYTHPAAPVDERAEFEKWIYARRGHTPNIGQYFEEWAAWQARAALERKKP